MEEDLFTTSCMGLTDLMGKSWSDKNGKSEPGPISGGELEKGFPGENMFLQRKRQTQNALHRAKSKREMNWSPPKTRVE